MNPNHETFLSGSEEVDVTTDSNRESDSDFVPPSISENDDEGDAILSNELLSRKYWTLEPALTDYDETSNGFIYESCENTDISGSAYQENNQECSSNCSDTQLRIDPTDVDEVSNNQKRRTVFNNKRKRKHNCVYCDLPVYNFARHLERQHSDEFEVQAFMSKDKSNPERKQIIDKIRKEGDFCSGEPVPVQGKKNSRLEKIGVGYYESKSSLLPCIHCRGYYSKKYLRRHVKRCHLNKAADTSKRTRPQADGQTLMSGHFGPNDPLRTSGVLTSLRADEISLVAKRDKLICEVARKYLKSHREKHLTMVARRYMRRLARLLMEVRNIENDKSLQLLSILNPTKFKAIVAATRKICCYDSSTKKFRSPSFALQLGTIIKKAISAAYSMEVQKNCNSPRLAVLVSMKKLVEEEWAVEVSTEAGQNLNLNRFNKPTLMPVAEDISKMKKYLDKLVLDAKTKLAENDKNEDAYRQLIEGCYCNLLLFNKRRVGELQRILLDTYLKVQNSQPSGDFEKLLSQTEKILIKNIKRIVIRGKRGRGVPVLFDKSTQEALDLAIQCRSNFYEANNNPYLFGVCHTESCISGYHIFRKHVKMALGDVNKTSVLTSTKLRKHLATIAQILKMGSSDLEQLATFMGHTTKTHNEWYRLPSDIYQTAKVAKILLLAQETSIDKYMGRDLNELDVDEDIVVDVHSNSEDEAEGMQEEHVLQNEKAGTSKSVDETRVIDNKKNKRLLKKWSCEEKEATKKFFEKHIKMKRPPKKDEVLKLVEKHPSLFNDRSWQTIKVFVCNLYSK